MNASEILTKVLKYSGILAVLLIVIGGTIGYLVDGSNGLISVLLGTAVAVLFSAVTAASMMVAIKFEIAAFFGIVMGSWLLKMVLFIVGTVAIDTIVVIKSRMSYVSDVSLPTTDGRDDAV
jgi:hypothetical protein